MKTNEVYFDGYRYSGEFTESKSIDFSLKNLNGEILILDRWKIPNTKHYYISWIKR